MAFVVSSEIGEKIEDVIWNMSCLAAFKIVALSYQMKTGKTLMNHKEKKMARKQSELVERLQSGNQ